MPQIHLWKVHKIFCYIYTQGTKSMYACYNCGGTINMSQICTFSAKLLKSRNHYSYKGQVWLAKIRGNPSFLSTAFSTMEFVSCSYSHKNTKWAICKLDIKSFYGSTGLSFLIVQDVLNGWDFMSCSLPQAELSPPSQKKMNSLHNSLYRWTCMFCLKAGSIPSTSSFPGTLPCCSLFLSHNLLHQDIFPKDCPKHFPWLFLFSLFKHLTITADISFLNSFGSPITAARFRGFTWVLLLAISWFPTSISPSLTYLLSFHASEKNPMCVSSCVTSLSQTSAVPLLLRGLFLALFWLPYLPKVMRLHPSGSLGFFSV